VKVDGGWLLADAHGERDAARVVARLPGAVEERCDARLRPTLEAALAELGDPSRFRNAAALASYVGLVPRLRQSGKRAFSGARGLPLGNARLRHRL
jgi:transposase